MLMFFLKAYLWVALFTSVSIAFESPLTGSKEDYAEMRNKIQTNFSDSRGWMVFTYLFVLLWGTLAWPLTYYYRMADVWRQLTTEPCSHSLYRENQACDAICITCNKNLGFIQNQREKNPRGEVE